MTNWECPAYRFAPATGLDMSRRADVIVTEIFDSELLGEGILPTMRHAAAHLLKVTLSWFTEMGLLLLCEDNINGHSVQACRLQRLLESVAALLPRVPDAQETRSHFSEESAAQEQLAVSTQRGS